MRLAHFSLSSSNLLAFVVRLRMPLNSHFPIALLLGFLSLALLPKYTFGIVQSTPHEASDETSSDLLVSHPQINEHLAQGKDLSKTRVHRRNAIRKAILTAESENDRQLELRTLIISLEVIWPMSNTFELKGPLDRMVELNENVGNPRFTALIQIFQARHLFKLNRYQEAIELIEKAQASNHLSKSELARSYNHLSFAWGRLGLVRNSFDACRRAIALYKDGEQAEELTIAKSNFAWMLVRTKRFDKAEQLYDEIVLRPEDKPYTWSLVARCEIALHRKNFDRAMQLSQLGIEAVGVTQQLSNIRKNQVKGTLYMIQSQCLYANKEFAKAKSVCKQALEFIPDGHHRFSEAQAQLALITAELDSPSQALKIARKAFESAMALRAWRVIDRVHVQLFSSEVLTELQLKNGQVGEAYAQLKKTKEIRESLAVEDLELQLKLSEMHRQAEVEEQRLELIKTEEQAKTAQAVLVAENAIADIEKSKVVRNVIGTVLILTLLGGVGYGFSENRRRQVECQLKETRERAEYQELLAQAKRIDDIGQLTGSVAHDFNNILQVICQTDFLIEDSVGEKLTGQQRELLKQKSSALDAATKITGQLLTYARRQAITPKVALVSSMLQSTEALFDSIGDLIQVNVLNFDETLAINVDQPQFSSAILNLLLNARDAMEGQGLVDVKVSEQLITEPNSLALEAGDYVRVEVSDTGKGMTKAQLDRSCEPFFTTKPPETGKGLGLSSVKGFVEQADGAISIQSKPEVGTIVSLYFPKIEYAEVCNSSADSESSRSNKNGRVCLIIEDNIEVRTTLALMMESCGFDCTSCSSADEAQILLKSRHDFSLVLSDVQVPGKWDGVDLAEWIRMRFPKIRVVLISGNDPPPNLKDFIFLRKPIRFSDLQAELQLELV